MSRRIYSVILRINGRALSKVIIDPHYEERRSESVSDEIILQLVWLLNRGQFLPDSIDVNGFQYYANDGLFLLGKRYRLIWLLHSHENYIGIVNAYRR